MLVLYNSSVMLILYFFILILESSPVLFLDRNTVSNTASDTCAFHSCDWQQKKKKTKIPQNEQRLWWLDLKGTREMKYLPQSCPHDGLYKDFWKAIPFFSSSFVTSSKLTLLLLKLAVGLIKCGHHKSSSPCEFTISHH